MTNSNTVKTATVNNEIFTLTPTYEEMDDQLLMHLSDQMLRELGGSRCVNSEIEFILKHADHDYDNAPFCSDDITNMEPTGEFETANGWEEFTEKEKESFINDLQEQIESLEEIDLDEMEDSQKEELEELRRLLDDAEDTYCENYPEIVQWFCLDERLIYRLDEEGECTLVGEYWGRQAFGQSITMDHCMKKACYGLAMCWAS